MNHSIKSHGIALATGIALSLAAFTAPASAQDAQHAAARQLVLEAWTTSRSPELYKDLRRTVRTVMIPATGDLVSGNVKMPLAQIPQVKAWYVTINGFMKTLDKAGDEIDVAVEKYRDEFVNDVAFLVAKHLTAEEVEGVRGGLQLAATRKSFNALYMVYGIVTGFTYDDVHANQLFSAWGQEIFMQYAARNGQPESQAAPSAERVAKATAIVSEFMTSARVDDMVADGLRFAREVVVVIAPETENVKANWRTQIDTFEQQYTAQKPMLLILAPTGLATVLSDAQIDQLQTHMRGPGISKLYKTVYAAERAVTTLTVSDFNTAKAYLEGLQAKGLFKVRTSEQKAAFDADMKAFGEKWGPRLEAAISPETRAALQQSIMEFENISKAPGGMFGLPAKPM